MRLRVKDLDFDYMEILVRDGKGEKDRRTILPSPPADPLRHQLARAKMLHDQDLRDGFGAVYLSDALGRKYHLGVYIPAKQNFIDTEHVSVYKP